MTRRRRADDLDFILAHRGRKRKRTGRIQRRETANQDQRQDEQACDKGDGTTERVPPGGCPNARALLQQNQETRASLQTSVAYFQTHREHLHYQKVHRQGGPAS